MLKKKKGWINRESIFFSSEQNSLLFPLLPLVWLYLPKIQLWTKTWVEAAEWMGTQFPLTIWGGLTSSGAMFQEGRQERHQRSQKMLNSLGPGDTQVEGISYIYVFNKQNWAPTMRRALFLALGRCSLLGTLSRSHCHQWKGVVEPQWEEEGRQWRLRWKWEMAVLCLLRNWKIKAGVLGCVDGALFATGIHCGRNFSAFWDNCFIGFPFRAAYILPQDRMMELTFEVSPHFEFWMLMLSILPYLYTVSILKQTCLML